MSLRLVALFIALGANLLISAVAHAAARTITFSGHTWTVKSSRGLGRIGPGPNHFSDLAEHVWVDAKGYLHLKLSLDTTGRWQCAEVYTQESLGYGTYTFVTGTPVDDFDPSVVLGLFTYEDDLHELDFEYSRWSNEANPRNGQFVVQPYYDKGNIRRWTMPTGYAVLSHQLVWLADHLRFTVRGSGTTLRRWDYTNAAAIPAPGGERVHLNLYLDHGRVPVHGGSTEVVIRRFTFTPAP